MTWHMFFSGLKSTWKWRVFLKSPWKVDMHRKELEKLSRILKGIFIKYFLLNIPSGLWKYHARLVRPGPISFRTSWKFLFTCSWTSTNVLSQCNFLFHILINYYKLTSCIENSVDPDQLASEEASWSGSTLFTREAIGSGSLLFTRVDIYLVKE